MALWGLRWHNDGRPDRWWEPKPIPELAQQQKEN